MRTITSSGEATQLRTLPEVIPTYHIQSKKTLRLTTSPTFTPARGKTGLGRFQSNTCCRGGWHHPAWHENHRNYYKPLTTSMTDVPPTNHLVILPNSLLPIPFGCCNCDYISKEQFSAIQGEETDYTCCFTITLQPNH